jgi:hypothetical protein
MTHSDGQRAKFTCHQRNGRLECKPLAHSKTAYDVLPHPELEGALLYVVRPLRSLRAVLRQPINGRK